jgi:aspartate 1-decarboxylase
MGSITVDPDLLDAVGMVVNEKVLVADVENGARFETYIFLGERGTGHIIVNGAAAHLTDVGHRVLIMAFCHVDARELPVHRPRVIICDHRNRIAERVEYPTCGTRNDVVSQVV